MNLIQPCAQCSCLAVCALLLTNCAGEDSRAPSNEPVFRFSTLVGEAAINLTTTSGTQPATQILEVNGGGLGLIDFDNGSGYYCWRWPETDLAYFHGYEEGFGGRIRIQ